MTCRNKVSYWMPRGNDYREVLVRCGLTDPYGGRAICNECASDRDKAAEHERHERLIAEDNATARAAGLGEF